jgi:LysM repeat protein
MKRTLYTLFLLAATALGSPALAQTYAEKVQRYVATYKDLAMQEQQRSGIPAAITLAQGILESGAGESELATEASNHFGIKCKKTWTGETYNHDDDAEDECFRKYPSAEASYRDHTDYLKSAGRYTPCFAQSTTDYAGWAYQLKTCGYATSPTYAQRLIRIIEDYKLQQYTYAALESNDPLRRSVAGENVPENDEPAPTEAQEVRLGEAPTPRTDDTESATSRRAAESRMVAHSETPEEAAREARARQAAATAEVPVEITDGVITKDGRRGFWAKRGDVLLEDAIRHRIRYAKLLEINGLPDEPLAADRFIYLEKASTTRFAADVAAAAGRDETAHVASVDRPRPMSADAAMPVEQRAEVVATPTPARSEEPPVETREEVTPVIRKEPQLVTEVTEEPKTIENTPEPEKSTATHAVEETPASNAPATEVLEEASVSTTPGTVPERAPAVTESPETPVMTAETSINAGSEANAVLVETTPIENVKPVEDGVNIADESAVEETQPVASAVPEPQDEMSRLKARFDKAVYSPSAKRTQVTTPAETSTTPASKAAVGSKPVPVVASNASSSKFYTVQKGDTAFGIAKKHGITVRQLQEWNGLSMEAGVPLGKKLKVQP